MICYFENPYLKNSHNLFLTWTEKHTLEDTFHYKMKNQNYSLIPIPLDKSKTTLLSIPLDKSKVQNEKLKDFFIFFINNTSWNLSLDKFKVRKKNWKIFFTNNITWQSWGVYDFVYMKLFDHWRDCRITGWLVVIGGAAFLLGWIWVVLCSSLSLGAELFVGSILRFRAF